MLCQQVSVNLFGVHDGHDDESEQSAGRRIVENGRPARPRRSNPRVGIRLERACGMPATSSAGQEQGPMSDEPVGELTSFSLSRHEAELLEALLSRDVARMEEQLDDTGDESPVLAHQIEELRRIDARLQHLLRQFEPLPDALEYGRAAEDPARTNGDGEMDVFEVIHNRRSIRSFLPQPVDPQDQLTILDASRRAPSAGNEQAYSVVLVTRDDVRGRLADAAEGQTFVAQAPLVLVFCAIPGRSAVVYADRGAQLFSLQDATIACAYAQLAAAALGLSAVWVGSFDPAAVGPIIDAPEGTIPIAMLAIGHPAETGEASPRRPLADLVRRVE
jgi:nitroreductase